MITNILDNPRVYLAWQYPFIKQKLVPVMNSSDFATAKSVLDIGCGPGTSSCFFSNRTYLGVDLNPSYIEYSIQHRKGRFVIGNAAELESVVNEAFDMVLVNSLLHHLTDEQVDKLVDSLPRLLNPSGNVWILDISTDYSNFLCKLLAEHDRGKYLRKTSEIERLAKRELNVVETGRYPLNFFGITLWDMCYVRCQRRS